jgi:predicted outer membrane repeat protein
MNQRQGTAGRGLRKVKIIVGALILAACASVAPAAARGTVLHVDDDAPPGGDGLSWPTAFRFLQDALAIAADAGGAVDEIRIAGGVYRPDRDADNPDGTGDRAATFMLVDGVNLVGGYAGFGGGDPDERDIALYETILDGDLAGDDGEEFQNIAENSLHVVTGAHVSPETTLDGITIRGGNADGLGPDFVGAGMLNDLLSDPTIIACTFIRNSAGQGGGMYNRAGCDPTLVECTIRDNRALVTGGGMQNAGNQPALTDCLFTGNMAGQIGGGGMYNIGAAPLLTDCTFSDNEAFQGGGMFSVNSAATGPVLVTCTFSDNFAFDSGAAMFSINESVGSVLNECVFVDNIAIEDGAAMRIEGVGPATADHCLFGGNLAGDLGGALFAAEAGAMFTACTFTGNTANDQGGGVYDRESGVDFVDCIFEANHAGLGGGAAASSDGDPAFNNCAFTANSSDASGGAAYVNAGSPSWTACTFSGNTSATTGAGIFNIEGSPTVTGCAFTSNTSGGAGGGMYNIDGFPTVIDCTFSDNLSVSFGSGAGIHSSRCGASVSGCTFTNNSASLGGAVFESDSIDTIIEDCTFAGNSALSAGALFLSEGDTTVRNCDFASNSAANAGGGAVYVLKGGPTLESCTFDANTADLYHGGALYNDAGNPVMLDCTFTQNTAEEFGGAVYSRKGAPRLEQCRLVANGAQERGGAVYADIDSPTLIDCALYGNTAPLGGGTYHLLGELRAMNCLFSGNVAMGKLDDEGQRCVINGLGGACVSIFTNSIFVNCTFSANAAECEGEGGGVTGVTGVIANCIFWNNTDENGSVESSQIHNSDVAVNYCCVEGLTGGFGGEGNIDADPLFLDPDGPDDITGTADDDLHLGAGSPCIDAADNTAVPEGITTDLDGEPRFVDDPGTADTGFGEPPLVDMGAYEFQVESCPADFDNDGDVDAADLLILLGAWGTAGPDGDVDGDGDVDTMDLLALLGAWGECRE